MRQMPNTNKTAQEIIAAMDDFLNEGESIQQPLSVKDYWAQSVSASVFSDYKSGRVVNVKC